MHLDAGDSLRHQAQDVKVAYLWLWGELKISLNTSISLSSVSHTLSFLLSNKFPTFCSEYKWFSWNAGTGTSPRDLQHSSLNSTWDRASFDAKLSRNVILRCELFVGWSMTSSRQERSLYLTLPFSFACIPFFVNHQNIRMRRQWHWYPWFYMLLKGQVNAFLSIMPFSQLYLRALQAGHQKWHPFTSQPVCLQYCWPL